MERRVLIIAQNPAVPFDRRGWVECKAIASAGDRVAVVCAKGNGNPAHQVIDKVEAARSRPHQTELPEEPRFSGSYTLYDRYEPTALVSLELEGHVGQVIDEHSETYHDNSPADMAAADARTLVLQRPVPRATA